MMSDTWAEADAYEPYVGRWSRLVAREFLAWLNVPPSRVWVDVGCGTGALSHATHTYAPGGLIAVDRSRAYLDVARRRASGAIGGFVVADARSLPFVDARFDVAVSGLVLNFVPEPARMIMEMRRVLRPSGRLALYVWDYAGRMELMRHFWDAAVDLDPGASAVDEGRRFPVCRPQPLRSLFEECGLAEVEVRAIDVPTVFRSFADYWAPFLGGQGPAPGYVASLDDEHRSRLAELIRSRLRHAADGSISLVARAWACAAAAQG